MHDPKDSSLVETMQEQLANKIAGMFGFVLSERQLYYHNHPENVPARADVKSLIRDYRTRNAAVSGAAGLVPGPWGLLTVVPDIALVLRNQVAMIYDIGLASGHRAVLNRDVLLGVSLTAFGSGGIGLLTIHGGEILVKRASLTMIQNAVSLLAGNVTQQLVKSTISRWVPLVGAAAMGTWSAYTTQRIGKKAAALFAQPIELQDEEADGDEIGVTAGAEESLAAQHPPEPAEELVAQKILALANMMKSDRQMTDEERGFLETVIVGSGLGTATLARLRSSIEMPAATSVDYALFAPHPDEVVGLMVDMAAMAKRDGQVRAAEKVFIKQVGKAVGLDEEDVLAMLDEAA